MKIRFALLSLLLFVYTFAAGFLKAQTPGSALVPALEKLHILWRGFSDLRTGPDGDQWFVDYKAHQAKEKVLNTKWVSYDPRVNAFNIQNKVLDDVIGQWLYDCGNSAHPNGLPEPQFSECRQRQANLRGQQAALDLQRQALNDEFATLTAESNMLKNEYAVLMQRADKYNVAFQSLIDQYNVQLALSKTLVVAYLGCVKTTPMSCGSTGIWTLEDIQKILTYSPRPPLGVSPTQYGGVWQGTWTGEGFAYSLVMTLDWGTAGSLDGQIVWTLTEVPAGDKYDGYRSKIGHSATEYIRGNTGQLAGYSKTDPENIIGLDTYRLRIERENMDLIQGTTYTNQHDWSGRFVATRAK